MDNPLDLASLLNRHEDETLDFKASVYDLSDGRQKRNFAKDLASLSNTPREGEAYIVLGVKKQLDGSFTLHGIDKVLDDADLQNVASSLLEPNLRFIYYSIWHGDVLLGLITIPPSQEFPVVPKRTIDEGFTKGTIYFRRGSQNSEASIQEQARIWDWFRGRSRPTSQNPLGDSLGLTRNQLTNSSAYGFADTTGTLGRSLDAEALLLGPIQALDLTSTVEEAGNLTESSPLDAVRLYEKVAEILRERFPVHAEHFDRLRAKALRTAGNPTASHNILMKLAIRELLHRAEPRISAWVARDLEELSSEVDEVQRARGSALIHFGRSHEYSGELEKLAECYDRLGSTDEYSPAIAVLLAEAALADQVFQIMLDRNESLHSSSAPDYSSIGLRVRAALGDAGVPGVWPDLIGRAESFRFPAAEGSYVCMRGARWYAWNGELDKSKSLYRLAMKLGSEASLDLDVENALWSLTSLHALDGPSDELLETNRMALSMNGSSSYLTLNSRTQRRSYQYIVNGQLPDAHLWTRFRLLESIRSGCLTDELESHAILARIYDQSEEPLNALEHAVLGGSQKLVKELAPKAKEWPDFLARLAVCKAPWVSQAAFLALEYLGDLAPPEEARVLVPELLSRLRENPDDARIAPALLGALGAVIFEATDEDLAELFPILEQAAVREQAVYRLTDPGLQILAARLYRFRPGYRKQAASILGEMAVGSHTGAFSSALSECGEDTGDLIESLERVAEREGLDLSGPLSDLEHFTADTRAVWSLRLQTVANYPLGQRSQHQIGQRYDVPVAFLKEQSWTVVNQYVDKLVAIGSDPDQMLINRRTAFLAAANVIDALSYDKKRRLFKRVRTLIEQPIQISEMDRYDASSQHPLSRFRVSFGSANLVWASAGLLLGRAAANADERSSVAAVALDWVRSDDQVLQGAGASILSLPNLLSDDVEAAELARHKNPRVRRASLEVASMEAIPESTILEQLVSDTDRGVRIGVIHALRSNRHIEPWLYNDLRARLVADSSSVVRAIAMGMLGFTHD